MAFASHSLNATKIQYAQIKMEALSLACVCEFSNYILGKYIFLETDHKRKPLMSLQFMTYEVPVFH